MTNQVFHTSTGLAEFVTTLFELTTGLKGHLALLSTHSQARKEFIKADGNNMMRMHLACWLCTMQARQVLGQV